MDKPEKPKIKNAYVTINGKKWGIKANSFTLMEGNEEGTIPTKGNVSQEVQLVSWNSVGDDSVRDSHLQHHGKDFAIEIGDTKEIPFDPSATTKGDGTLKDWKKNNRVVKKKF